MTRSIQDYCDPKSQLPNPETQTLKSPYKELQDIGLSEGDRIAPGAKIEEVGLEVEHGAEYDDATVYDLRGWGNLNDQLVINHRSESVLVRRRSLDRIQDEVMVDDYSVNELEILKRDFEQLSAAEEFTSGENT